jgi:ABC-type lipoprotein export system ATPase subunit
VHRGRRRSNARRPCSRISASASGSATGPRSFRADSSSEPTGELDSRTAESILALFDTLHAGGQTLIVVTHSAAVYERAQRVIRLVDGKIVSDAA